MKKARHSYIHIHILYNTPPSPASIASCLQIPRPPKHRVSLKPFAPGVRWGESVTTHSQEDGLCTHWPCSSENSPSLWPLQMQLFGTWLREEHPTPSFWASPLRIWLGVSGLLVGWDLSTYLVSLGLWASVKTRIPLIILSHYFVTICISFPELPW